MVEVFKTNVNSESVAKFIVGLLNKNFPGYQANFDLDDCDKILRIKTDSENINAMAVINTLNEINVYAEVLSDALQPVTALRFLEELLIVQINSN